MHLVKCIERPFLVRLPLTEGPKTTSQWSHVNVSCPATTNWTFIFLCVQQWFIDSYTCLKTPNSSRRSSSGSEDVHITAACFHCLSITGVVQCHWLTCYIMSWFSLPQWKIDQESLPLQLNISAAYHLLRGATVFSRNPLKFKLRRKLCFLHICNTIALLPLVPPAFAYDLSFTHCLFKISLP